MSAQLCPSNSNSIAIDQTAHELGVSDLVSTLAIKDPAPVAHPEASFPSAIIQADLGLEQNQNPEAVSRFTTKCSWLVLKVNRFSLLAWVSS